MADSTMKVEIITAKPKNLELPKGFIMLKVSSKDIDVSLMDRITDPVRNYLNDYRKMAIDPAILQYDKQLEGMTDKKEADKLAKQVNEELKKLVGNLEKEAENRIKASWEKIKKENTQYTKWKLKIAAKVIWGTIKIAKGLAALVASAGAKADEYYKVAKSAYSIAKELQKAFASESKVREQVMKAVEKLSAATKDGKAGKSHISKVEDAVKEYNQKLTATRQKASSLSGPLEKLLQLQDKGVPVTSKQETQINNMIVQIIEFNTTEDNGRKFAQAALTMANDTKGKLDLKTLKGYAEKTKKGIEMAIKIFKVASDIL
jgi:hypothetical protein